MLLHRAAGEVCEHTFASKPSHHPHRMLSLTRSILYRTLISRLTLQVWLSSAYAASSWEATVDLPARYAPMENRTLPLPSSIHVDYRSSYSESPFLTPEQVFKHIYLQMGHEKQLLPEELNLRHRAGRVRAR